MPNSAIRSSEINSFLVSINSTLTKYNIDTISYTDAGKIANELPVVRSKLLLVDSSDKNKKKGQNKLLIENSKSKVGDLILQSALQTLQDSSDEMRESYCSCNCDYCSCDCDYCSCDCDNCSCHCDYCSCDSECRTTSATCWDYAGW